MTTTINGRTPEEIKKGLELCRVGKCSECPYREECDEHLACGGDMLPADVVLNDIAALIQQLEAERDRYKRELDAAVKELRRTHNCNICKHHKKSGGTCEGWSVCGYNMPSWEWRGVQGVE